MTNDEAALLALKETLRYGMFLGTFAGAYVSVDECIAALWGRKRSAVSVSLTPRCQLSTTTTTTSQFLPVLFIARAIDLAVTKMVGDSLI